MNVYGHAREDRLANAVERVAEVVLPVKRVPVEYQQAVGAETKIATPLKTEDCDNKKWWRRRESNPDPNNCGTTNYNTPNTQNRAKSRQYKALGSTADQGAKQDHALSKHNLDSLLHSERVPEEYQFPSDLEKLIARWPILSAEIRTAILAIVDSSQ